MAKSAGMKIVTAEQMRDLDRRAMAEGGMPGSVLMENAGRAVFEVVSERYGDVRNRPFLIACGTGNNGGDGFVAARYLHLAGAKVQVWLCGAAERLKGDAAAHCQVMRHMGLVPREDPPDVPADTVCIDALLGTGAKDAPRGRIAEAIRWLNDRSAPTVAVDIPSGVDSDTGAAPGEAIHADMTIAFAYPKIGLFLPPATNLVGELIVRDIGFAWDTLAFETPFRWLQSDKLSALLPPRPREAHKGQAGHVLILGGSRGMSGAPTLAARAALRTGVGLVTVAAPESAQGLIAGKLDEAMTIPLPEKNGALAESGWDVILAKASASNAVCIGPGATQEPETQSLLLRLLHELKTPVVLDADGLNALAACPDAQAILTGRSADTVLTPHPGECARLLGTDTENVQSDRIRAVRETAVRFRSVVVLKGANTLICDGRKDELPERLPIAVNTTGNPGMATGGMGDTLTGILGALLAQKPQRDTFDAACLSVYLHGLAGDLAAQEGETGLIAGDVSAALPRAINLLQQS